MSTLLRRSSIIVAATAMGLWSVHLILTPRPGPVSRAIGAALDNQERPVEIARFTRFKWDEMFVAGGYTGASDDMRRKWCEHVTLSSEQCSQVKFAPASDGWATLVFRNKGKLAHSESHSRRNGDWYPFPAKQPLSPSEAVFEVMLDRDLGGAGTRWRWLVRPGDPRPPGSVPVAQAESRP